MDVSRREFFRTLGIGGSVGQGASLARRKAQTSHSAPVSDDLLALPVDTPKCSGRDRCELRCRDAAGFSPPPTEGAGSKDDFHEPYRPRPRARLLYHARRGEACRYGRGGTGPAAYQRHGSFIRAGTGIAGMSGGGVGCECADPGRVPVTSGTGTAGALQSKQESVRCALWTASRGHRAYQAGCRCPTRQVASTRATARGLANAGIPIGLGRSSSGARS
jgi:hypothetical protein